MFGGFLKVGQSPLETDFLRCDWHLAVHHSIFLEQFVKLLFSSSLALCSENGSSLAKMAPEQMAKAKQAPVAKSTSCRTAYQRPSHLLLLETRGVNHGLSSHEVVAACEQQRRWRSRTRSWRLGIVVQPCWDHIRRIPRRCKFVSAEQWQLWYFAMHCLMMNMLITVMFLQMMMMMMMMMITTSVHFKGEVLETSHDLAPKSSQGREIALFQENPGWWSILIWPDKWSFRKGFLGWCIMMYL